MCRIVSNEIYAEVKTDKHLFSKLKVNKGLRQADAVAPSVFSVVLEMAEDLKYKHMEPYLTDAVKL
jgi:hypothetical protein